MHCQSCERNKIVFKINYLHNEYLNKNKTEKSMPKVDVNGVVDCRNDNIDTSPKGVIKGQNGIIDKLAIQSTNKNSKITKTLHSPKVFAADSITVNTPAKDVLGSKFNSFTKNRTQIMPGESKTMTKINDFMECNGHMMNGNGTSNGIATTPISKLQPVSACYDRYPKPGSYGCLQVYPMNGVNSEINNAKENHCIDMRSSSPRTPKQRYRDDDEISKIEQDRLEEILKMCADFERQNQNVQSSPIVQNRIKTNGSLPREKKSPLSPDHHSATGNGPTMNNIFFPSSPCDSRKSNQNHTPTSSPHCKANTQNTGYENIRMLSARRVDQLSSSSSLSSSSRFDHDFSNKNQHLTNGNSTLSNGYENVTSSRKSPAGYVPQSPRTRIKTCISPKREITSTPIQRKTDYDLLVQSFEEKLRMEIQQLRDNRNNIENNHCSQIDNNNRCANQRKFNSEQIQHHSTPEPKKLSQNSTPTYAHHYVNLNRTINLQEGIYGTLTYNKNTRKHSDEHKPIVRKHLDEKQIVQLKRQQVEVLKNARELKAQISELQRQEEEVLREVC